MRWIGLFALLAATLASFGCGGSSSETINGIWLAQLNDNTGPVLAFQAMLQESSGSTVNVTNFSFGGTPSCFPSTSSQTAQFTKTGNFHGFPTGPFAMTISTIFPAALNNVLTLQGAVIANDQMNERISGTWTHRTDRM